MKNFLEMLKALDKHLCPFCKNPAEGKVPECFVTGKICCVCSSERQSWELPKASRGLGIIPRCLYFLLEGCDSPAMPGALPIMGWSRAAELCLHPSLHYPLHIHIPASTKPSFMCLSSFGSVPGWMWVMDRVWMLRGAWPSSETFRRVLWLWICCCLV